jgi:hypothetical protein
VDLSVGPIGVSMKSTALYSKTRRKKKRSRRDKCWSCAAYQRAIERRVYGSQGPASAVRKIDPATGQVMAVIPAKIPT